MFSLSEIARADLHRQGPCQAKGEGGLSLKKRWGGEKAKTGVESGIDVSLPASGEKHLSLLVLFLLLAITFFPLILGKNFVPFERYPQWSLMLAQSSGQKIQVESSAFKRLKLMPWAEDAEVGSIGVTWAENLYFARKLKQGQLPLWDPYTGCGVPTLDSGQCRPFNPFRLPFYLFPTTWVYSLTMVAALAFGAIGAYLWLLRHGFSPAAITLGTGLFVLNPWVLDRLVLTDSGAYFVLPWCLLALQKAEWGNWPKIARAALCFVLMGHLGHPVVSFVMAAVAVAVYLLSEGGPWEGQKNFFEKAKTLGVVVALTSACLAVLWLPLLKLLVVGYLYKKHAWFIYAYKWKSLTVLPSDMFVPPAVIAILACAFFSWKILPKVWMILLAIVLLVLLPLPWIGIRLSTFLSYLGLPTLYLKGVFWASISILAPYGLDAYGSAKRVTTMTTFAIAASMLTVSAWQFISLPMAKDSISAFPVAAFFLLALGPLALIIFRTFQGRLGPMLLSVIILIRLPSPSH